jgi:hypothetical protein
VGCSSKEDVWDLAERLLGSIFIAVRKIDELAPEFPDEWFEARDQKMEGLQVDDYMTRLVQHNQIHRNEIASVRAAIGRSRPTDPNDSDPSTNEPYAKVWYQWRILEAFLRRAEMVSELIGLSDEDIDKKPSPELVAGNDRSIREICEHVLHVQKWIMSGIENGIEEYRKNK